MLPLPSVAIVILNWNGKKFLEQFLPSVLSSTYKNYSVIVADNASTDDSIQFLQTAYPQIKILTSKVNALFRRLSNEGANKIKVGNFVIDREKYLVTFEETDIVLARKEFELLALLASKPGKVFLRNEILNRIWGTDVIVGDRTIDVHIRKIRQKLGVDCITTVKGVGYKFEL